MKKISLIVPCFNEEATIQIYYEEVIKYLNNDYDFNVIFVDDGSHDSSLNIMRSLASKDKRIKYVSFSRNFGKESAMYAGLEHAKILNSDAAIIMDVDLQDPPSLILEFLNKYEEGYKLIYAKQRNRDGAKLFSKICSLSFYKVYSFLTKDKQMKNGARDFCLLDKKVIDAFLNIKDESRFTKGIYHYVGFKTTTIEFDYVGRSAGETKWGFRKLFKYAFTGIKEFSNFYNIIPSIIIFIWSIVFGVDLIYQIVECAKYNNIHIWDFSAIRIDLAVISIAFITKYIFKLLYEVRSQARNRAVYICEETNIETK